MIRYLIVLLIIIINVSAVNADNTNKYDLLVKPDKVTKQDLFPNITAAQARAILDSGTDTLFLDVRESYEFSAGHIPGATNMPWNSGILREAYITLPTDKPIIVYCASGGRSHSASEFLWSKGYTNISNMLGGYSAWTQLPERTATPTPFERSHTNANTSFSRYSNSHSSGC